MSTESTESQTQTPPDDGPDFKQQRDVALSELGKMRRQIADLQPKILTDEERAEFDTLKAARAKSDEDRARKAGEFETLRTQLSDKHKAELLDRETKLSTLSQRFKNTVVRAEFGAATDYFNGSDASRTILDVDLAMAALGKYVAVEDTDDEIGYRVVVKTPKGDIIFGADGNPAPFADAIGELITQLPNKDRILRGGGKTGSGSSGGSTRSAVTADVTELTKRANQGDPEAIKALRQRRNAGHGLVMGTAFNTR